MVEVTFADRSRGLVDVSRWIVNSKDHEAGTIVWPNGADLDPDGARGFRKSSSPPFTV